MESYGVVGTIMRTTWTAPRWTDDARFMPSADGSGIASHMQ